jgi:hypothetical protein
MRATAVLYIGLLSVAIGAACKEGPVRPTPDAKVRTTFDEGR